MSNKQFFATILAFCVILYLVVKPFHYYSDDSALTRSFKLPLIALLESDRDSASLIELYGGTIFEGELICMHYPYPAIKDDITSHEIIQRYFPDRAVEIQALKLPYKRPEWMLVVSGAEGFVVAMGKREIEGKGAYLKFSKKTKALHADGAEDHSWRSRGCLRFSEGIIQVKRYDGGSAAIILTDKEDVPVETPSTEPLPPSTP